VLIDEARTPLIISAESGTGDEEQLAREALTLANQLTIDVDYRVRRSDRRILLTEAGRLHIIDLCHTKSGIWAIGIRREELALRALSALHLYVLDEHYLLREGKVEVIDEFTGRVMPDRSWSQGLHQMIEVKEGCKVTTMRDTLASISYQRFFRRYLKISGMTGTAKEVRAELGSNYHLPVVRIPNHRKSKRRYFPATITQTNAQKWQCIVDRAIELNRRGIPVLIGTRSVAGSEQAMHMFEQHGVEAAVLNAKQDQIEADLVALAGQLARITIATNMAGRGTDIMLQPEVRELGGLHVILTERHEARRIDRQLAGRAARQGDPGSFEEILSLEDDLIAHIKGQLTERLLRLLVNNDGAIGRWAKGALVSHAQQHTERMHYRIRQHLLKSDRATNDTLSFSGRTE
jgi:preprotein translocase subunit SecA